MNAVSIRGDWVGRVIDGRFSLLEWLGGSGTSSSFVTELDGPAIPESCHQAVLRPGPGGRPSLHLDATTPCRTCTLCASCTSAALRSMARPWSYVVTELAEEVLSQIIPERPLTPDEAREMLEPVLDALSYLHANGLCARTPQAIEHPGGRKRSEVVGGWQSRDGKPGAANSESSDVHNAPETATKPMAPSADIWSLGVTIVEALTQQLPVWDSASEVRSR